MDVKVGTSAFYNAKWKNVFYPGDVPSKNWFQYYASRFDTFEINATFYRMPTLKVMQNWSDRVGDGFLYSVKAPKVVTHLKKFSNCEAELASFYEVCSEGLGNKLACILFQFPPSLAFDWAFLEKVLDQLDPNFTNVIEFRNISWWRNDVFEALAKANVVFCGVDYPKLPKDIFATNDLIYVRLHGTPELFYSEYSEAELQSIAQSAANAKKSFVYFNNTASDAGIKNALAFQKIIAGEKSI
jgi:uncharacterized protein YecE (DUF72 family)